MKTNSLTPIPGIAGAIATLGEIFAKAAPKLPTIRPRVTLPPRPLDKLHAFDNPDDSESVGIYVTRYEDGLPDSVEVVVEVLDWIAPDPDREEPGDVILGNAWNLRTGYMETLSLEEAEQARQEWISIQKKRAADAKREEH